jgi:hypothetical protein
MKGREISSITGARWTNLVVGLNNYFGQGAARSPLAVSRVQGHPSVPPSANVNAEESC